MSALVKTAEFLSKSANKGPTTTVFNKDVKLSLKNAFAASFIIGAVIGGGNEMLNNENSTPGRVTGEAIDGGFYITGKVVGIAGYGIDKVGGVTASELRDQNLEEIPNFVNDMRSSISDAGDQVTDGMQSLGG